MATEENAKNPSSLKTQTCLTGSGVGTGSDDSENTATVFSQQDTHSGKKTHGPLVFPIIDSRGREHTALDTFMQY